MYIYIYICLSVCVCARFGLHAPKKQRAYGTLRQNLVKFKYTQA